MAGSEQTVEALAADHGQEIEETTVDARTDFPARVILRCLRADGTIITGVLAPVMAHKLSNDLLLAAAATVRKDRG